VANATSAQDAATQVRQRLATIARLRSLLEREQRRAVLKELTLQLEAITGPISQADPAAARELLWQVLELGNNVLGRSDDSSGLLGDVFRQAMVQLGRLTEAAPPDPAPLAEQVFEAYCDNGYSDQPEAIRDGVGEALRRLPGGRSTGASHCRAQCCHVRHTAQRPAGAPQILELVSRTHQLAGLPSDLPIQELMRRLAEDPRRTERIVAEARQGLGAALPCRPHVPDPPGLPPRSCSRCSSASKARQPVVGCVRRGRSRAWRPWPYGFQVEPA
jgi:hypothetical protein